MRIIDVSKVEIDSTKIDAYKKSKPKNHLKNDEKFADWGCKNVTDVNINALVTNYIFYVIVKASYH